TQLASKKPSFLSRRASIIILSTSLLVTLRVISVPLNYCSQRPYRLLSLFLHVSRHPSCPSCASPWDWCRL
ncbi:hypothetical protein BGY98DRAFT_1011965, partial [Russula aff. rugulosa BPL654]